MNTLKVVPLACFALMIDGFTFFVGLALSIIAAAPGTIAGCAAGSQVAGKFGCLAVGALGSLLDLSGVLQVVTEPVGIMLGVAIGICINLTLGSMLILFLVLFGMFDGKTVVSCLMGEAIPGINMLPLWTGMTIRCAMKAAQKENPTGILALAATLGGGLSLSNVSAIGSAIGGGRAVGQAVAQGQRMGAIARVAPEEDDAESLEQARENSLSEAKINLKGSIDRLKSGMNGDITPKTPPRYGAEFSA
jgi:hypothetical protein